MANKSRFIVAESSIKNFFKEAAKKVYTKDQLAEILNEKRLLWKLPASMYTDKFIERLQGSLILTKREFYFEGYLEKKDRYLVTEATPYQIAVSLINKSYLSHFTAAYLHGLTTQVPKTIYLSFEQGKKTFRDRELTQDAIDGAFSRPQRTATTRGLYDDYSFVILNGMYSNRAGVYTMNDLPVTNIERTLIDITVRPAYAGGVDSVLEMYKRAIDKVSMSKINALLDNLDFIYPYHQAIGFYMEKAGFDISRLERLKKRPMDYKFYLTYEMKQTTYNKDWQIYYPKGM